MIAASALSVSSYSQFSCLSAGQEAADSVGGDGAVLQADDPLEQQGHGRLPGTLVQVVGGGERDGPLVPRTRAMMADRASASSGSMTIL